MALTGCREASRHSGEDNIKAQDIERVELMDLYDKPIEDNFIRGKAVFLNFWATWCKPCIEEMESIDKASNLLQKEKIVFILASNESVEDIREFQNAHKYKFNYMQVMNSESLDIPALPTTFIYNSRGELVYSQSGVKNWGDSSNINMLIKFIKQ